MILIKRALFGVVCSLLMAPLVQADCQVSLSQPTVSYGKIRVSDIANKNKQWNNLSQRQVTLTAYCPDAQKMALFFDGKAGEQKLFTFGDNSRLLVVASDATLDGNPVQLNRISDAGVFIPNGQQADKIAARAGEGIVPVSSGTVVSGKQFTMMLTIEPLLNHNDLSLRDSRDIDSNIQVRLERVCT